MSSQISILSDDEVRKHGGGGDEQGFGSLATQKGNLPLKAVDVNGEITGLVAKVTLKQTFVNPHAEPLEATYLFPLPDRAAVTKFVMTVGSRVIEGILKERGEAREQYRQAIEAGHRAAIAEEERPGVFTMRVGNLMPGETATVHLEMTSPLPYSDGEATFRFPLVVAPRYIPGAPLGGENVGDGVASDTDAVPDASRITPPVLLPGFPNPVRLGITIDVDPAGLPLGAMKSSLHAVDESEHGGEKHGKTRRIRVQPGDRLNRDFILRIALAESAVSTSLAVTPDVTSERAGGEGTFALTLVPPAGADAVAKPRDVVFVLDRSGSMGGWKMVAARRAMARMVDTLTDRDRFAVYAFDDTIETPDGMTDASALRVASDRNRFHAIEFLAKIDARGGTEMAQPLDLAVTELSKDASRDRVVVLVTDGQVGNEDQILRTLGKRIDGMRFFTVGIDRAVNEAFLKRLAAIGGGASEIVEGEDRLDEVMDRIHRRIGTPVLTELVLESASFEIVKDSIVPKRFPALFAGAPLVIGGRYVGKPGGSITVKAKDAAGRDWSATVKAELSANGAIPAVWARHQVRELEDRYVITSDPELEKRIVATSLKFGVLCRFTSFVAIDRSEVVNKGGKNVRVTQPVDAPDGWDMPMDLSVSVDAEVEESGMTRAQAPSGLFGGLFGGGGRGSGSSGKVDRNRKAMSPPKMVAAKPAASPAPVQATAPEKARAKADEKERSEGGKKEDALDLAAYRARAKELADLLESGSGNVLTLGTVMVRLASLVEDLTSVGAPESIVKPLSLAVEALKVALTKNDAREIDAASAEAKKALTAFVAAGPAKPRTSRGLAFWK